MNSWKLNRSPALLLVPWLYYCATRVNRPLDLVFVVATSYVPAWWILVRVAELDLLQATLSFVLGYLCFVSFYEIGYFFNDSWDSKRQEGGRQRIGFSPGAFYSALFVTVRLGCWAGLGYALGWFGNPIWLGCYLALALAMLQHNLITSSAYRAASFFQLAVLRFVCPIAAALRPEQFVLALLPATLLYTYLRYLSYLDSKDLLAMPERRLPAFGAVQIAMLTPLVALIAYATGSPVLFELLIYFLAVFGGFALLGRSRPITEA